MYYSESSALIIVDLQKDFCPGGALAVKGGDEIVSGINRLMDKRTFCSDSLGGQSGLFRKIVLTADWHPAGHISFASAHNLDPYSEKETNGETINLWPDHCIAETSGAEFHSDLKTTDADLILRKGRNIMMDSYSAFFENDRKTPTGLAGYLRDHGLKKVYICGLAMDWCVYFSAIDSVAQGFETYVIKDLTRAVDLPSGYALEKEKEMKKAGISLIESSFFKAGRKQASC